MITKSIKNNLFCDIQSVSKNDLSKDSHFYKLYNNTMKMISANKYYYFNEKYFKNIEKINNIYLINIKNNNKIVGYSICFIYNNFIHYHLSCSDKSMNCITDYILSNIVKKFCNKSNTLILGGGLKDGDSLSKFKEKISNKTFDYIIYKNIINKEVYENLTQNINTNFFPKYRS